MDFKAWRLSKGLSLADVAGRLGIAGANPSREVQRIETGEARPDADLVQAIGRLTGGAVGADDLMAARLLWLKAAGRARTFAHNGSAKAGRAKTTGATRNRSAGLIAGGKKSRAATGPRRQS